ncbi:MAG: hypothetical protein KAQ68_11535 [Clostridiales bacterium]|nr:hypothetical protein [Clostridiales bacterium]
MRKHYINKYYYIIVILILVVSIISACTKAEDTATPTNVTVSSNEPQNSATQIIQTTEIPIINTEQKEETQDLSIADGIDTAKLDLVAVKGKIITHIMEMIVGEFSIEAMVEEFSWDKHDAGEYSITWYTSKDLYFLTINANGANITKKLDYSISSLTIENENWTLNNPTDEEIENHILAPFTIEYTAFKEAQPREVYGNFISVYGSGASDVITLDDDIAQQFVEKLKNSKQTMNPIDYRDTDDEFYECGIEIHLDDMRYDHRSGVNILKNADGLKIIGEYNGESPVSSEVYDEIIRIVKKNTDWYEVELDEVCNIESVELILGEQSIGKTSNKEEVKTIEEMLGNAQRMFGGSGCPFTAKLILTREDQTEVEILLATDSCGVFILGSSVYYEYNMNALTGKKQDNQKRLLNIFGYDYFEDIFPDKN